MKFFAAIALTSLPLLAVATPLEARWGACNTGSIQCCETTIDSTSPDANILVDILEGLLGGLGSVTGLIGTSCSPITSGGTGSGNACTSSPVCCTNNNVGGLFSVGCEPITL